MREFTMFGIGMRRRLDLFDLKIDSLELDNDLILIDKNKDNYTARSEVYIAYEAFLNGIIMKKVMLVEFYPMLLFEKDRFINRREDGSLIIPDELKKDSMTGQNYREGVKMTDVLIKWHFEEIRNKKKVELIEKAIETHKGIFEVRDEVLADMYYDAARNMRRVNLEKAMEYTFESLYIYKSTWEISP